MRSSNSPIYDNSSAQSELISPIDYQTNSNQITITNNDPSNLQKFENEINYCNCCRGPILDRIVLKVGSSTWHVRCLRCIDCGIPLIDKCYGKNEDIFCKEDFYRRYGTRCAACDEIIPPAEIIRKAQNFIYHIECFACISCHRQLNTGEEFFLLPSKKLMCRPDFEIAKAKEMDQGNKRPRTTITAKQLEALKKTYSESSKPARHVREQLSAKTGLDMRVVQVWFQNRRAKEKRMKKDANRTCWNTPYFQNNDGSCKVSSIKEDDSDLDSDEDQTNEPLDVTYQSDVESDSDVFSCYGGVAPSTTNVSSNSGTNNNNNNSHNVKQSKLDVTNELTTASSTVSTTVLGLIPKSPILTNTNISSPFPGAPDNLSHTTPVDKVDSSLHLNAMINPFIHDSMPRILTSSAEWMSSSNSLPHNSPFLSQYHQNSSVLHPHHFHAYNGLLQHMTHNTDNAHIFFPAALNTNKSC